MSKLIRIFFTILCTTFHAQVDYSGSWEDFYSYNNVKDFVKVDDIIYALADNAVFTYNESTDELNKFSSVQGLSGETTSAIYYSNTYKRLVIGYETGLLEVIDDDGEITISSDIVNFNQSGAKRINHISGNGDVLYLSTPFAIVEYDIDKLEFGDTFFIGNGSSSLKINKTVVLNNTIYAATVNGLFSADATSNLLIDFNNWTQEFTGRNLNNIVSYNESIFLSEGSVLYEYNSRSFNQVANFPETVRNLNSSDSNITISLDKKAIVLDQSFNQLLEFNISTEFDFNLNNSFFENGNIYLGTAEFGILKSSINGLSSYEEIHPEGPLMNDVFSIAVLNDNLWVVYGGYNGFYGSLFLKRGFSQFNGEKWINTKYDPSIPVTDLNHITIDPNDVNKVYLSSLGTTTNINSLSTGGLAVVENNQIQLFYNNSNSTIEDVEPGNINNVSIRTTGSVFDQQGNLWVASISFNKELHKLSPSGQWTAYDLSDLKTIPNQLGLSEIIIDRANTIWIGTRRNGIYAFNETGNQKKALTTTPNQGNLPDTDVLTVAVDRSNRVWMGTRAGMVVLRNAGSVFSSDVINTQPIIIEENGIGERLLGDQRVNSIVVDGADNKWFGTDSGGVIYTNPSGLRTLANFSTENSPLPSNRILKIKVDDTTGKVYFATDKGIVAYDSNVAPFGESLGEVYAYPNPALKNHETVTIDGRNGTNLPKGTNVKILDVAGNLVYETNVIEGQELQGGKVVWNKKNLAGRQVASGVYIVLLTNEDASETSTTKIAIVN